MINKTVAVLTIGGAVAIGYPALMTVIKYKSNKTNDIVLSVVTLLVAASAVNYAVNKIKFD